MRDLVFSVMTDAKQPVQLMRLVWHQSLRASSVYLRAAQHFHLTLRKRQEKRAWAAQYIKTDVHKCLTSQRLGCFKTEPLQMFGHLHALTGSLSGRMICQRGLLPS